MSTLAITIVIEAVKVIGTWILELSYKLLCKITSAVTKKLTKRLRRLMRKIDRANGNKRQNRFIRRSRRLKGRLGRWKSLKKWLATHGDVLQGKAKVLLDEALDKHVIPLIHRHATKAEREAARLAA